MPRKPRVAPPNHALHLTPRAINDSRPSTVTRIGITSSSLADHQARRGRKDIPDGHEREKVKKAYEHLLRTLVRNSMDMAGCIGGAGSGKAHFTRGCGMGPFSHGAGLGGPESATGAS